MVNAAKYPVGIQTFSEIREQGKLYADKTDLMYQMVTSMKYVFLSRPRRFGKSLLCSTLESYFQGRRELFEGLAIDSLETEWKRHPVLRFDLSEVKDNTAEGIAETLDAVLQDKEDELKIERTNNGLGNRLKRLILGCYEKCGEKPVVIIDEYDAPLLNVLHLPEELEKVRQLMRTFFSPLKKCDEYLRFVFISGITKFSQLSIFSELNSLTNISMTPAFSTLCGITRREIETTLGDGVNDLAEALGLSREETLDKLRVNYDGYHFSKNSEGVYNPFSLLKALMLKDVGSYWFASGTPTFLVEKLREFRADIGNIDGSTAMADDFDAPTENMKSILPLFYQSGYLTIKDYDQESEVYTLGYPNREVAIGLMNALYPFYVNSREDSPLRGWVIGRRGGVRGGWGGRLRGAGRW